MTFDHSNKPNHAGLPEAIAERMAAVFYSRRPLGLNVQYAMQDGRVDERSFTSKAAVDAFVKPLAANGQAFAISN